MMNFTVRKIPRQYTHLVNCALQQYRLLRTPNVSRGIPRLIKAVQGSSKLPLDKRAPRLTIGDHRFGEDSWFMSSTSKAETLGVADGVGGWRKMGIDPGAFAQKLMSNCCEFSEKPEYDGSNPRQLLIDGYDQLKKVSSVYGSSTACLVALHRLDCSLHSANLGDSGFLVLRNGRVLHRSDEQVHAFNSPYQLAVPPDPDMKNILCDSPKQAVTTKLKLQPGDLVLLGTDGLFDNVPESFLLHHLRGLHGETRPEYLQEAVNGLVEMAKDISLNPTFRTPFSLKARAHNMNYGDGGKPDDITVILASVDVADRM